MAVSNDVTIYRSVSAMEAQSIQSTRKFSIIDDGMDCKQFGFDLAETQKFGNKVHQNIIVSARVPKNSLKRFYTVGVDTTIFRHGTLTVCGDELTYFNALVSGTIKFIP